MSVAIPIPLLQNLPDVNVTPGVGVDEYALVYDHDTARFVLRAPATALKLGQLDVGDLSVDGQGIYLMSTIVDSVAKLLLLGSVDGKTWNFLDANTLFTSPSVSLRDPSILYHGEKHWIVYTSGGYADSNQFGVASSPDLLTWTHVGYVDCSSIAGAPNAGAIVWAPEWFEDTDGTLHVYVSIRPQTVGTFHIYEVHPTNAAMTTWSAPVLVFSGIANEGVIDPFVMRIGATYYLWYKGVPYTKYATGASATGPFTEAVTGDWAGWGGGEEGPSLVKINSTTWRIYFNITGTYIYYSESSDNFATWTTKTLITIPVASLCHGTVVRTTDITIMRNILAMYASTGGAFAGNVSIGGQAVVAQMSQVGPNPDGYYWRLYPSNAGYASMEVIKPNVGYQPLAIQPNGGQIVIGGITPDSASEVTIINANVHVQTWQTTAAGNLYRMRLSGVGSGDYAFENISPGVGFGNIVFSPNGGNVGIADTAPAEKLDVTGNANVTGVYKVDDVQVLSNRVIDARCADVANSGDATTDGLIDALRDAMVAHGLIAAA